MASASSARCPPLCRRNALWWSQTYGHNEDARQRPEAAAVAPSGRDGFYRAIRDNCVDQVQRFVAENPAAVFTKVASSGGTKSFESCCVTALTSDACPRVVIRLDDSKGSSTAGSKTRRLQIHFSEAVDDFTLEDIEASDGCEVVAFSMLRQDLFLVTVQLVRGNSASVEVPAGAARSAGGRCNAGSGPFQLQVSSPQ
uniref:Uncharacterized protein n=1 Tax=Phytophthora ramorum TaxID=164328 RepID=H3GL98_PHYRM